MILQKDLTTIKSISYTPFPKIYFFTIVIKKNYITENMF